MLQLYENIKRRRISLGFTQTDLADKLGYADKSMIAKIESGKVDLAQSKIIAFAKALYCSPSELMGWDEPDSKIDVEETACRPYPVIGEVAAGYGSEAIEEETGDYEQIPLEWLRGHNPDNFFVLRVKGDSMYPDYQDGDHVLVHRQASVDSGAVAAMLYDGEIATLKKVRYKKNESWVELIPRNPEYQTKRIENWDLNECRVLGEVRRLIRVVK